LKYVSLIAVATCEAAPKPRKGGSSTSTRCVSGAAIASSSMIWAPPATRAVVGIAGSWSMIAPDAIA